MCSVFCLDKLDEILAAAQHTITSDSQVQRGHVGRRDRSKSIVPNVSSEVYWDWNLTKTLTNTTRSRGSLRALLSVVQTGSKQTSPQLLDIHGIEHS